MKTKIIYIVLFALGIGFMAYGLTQEKAVHKAEETVVHEEGVETISNEEVRYQGHAGTDALTLLKEGREVVEQNGFVTAINGKEANLDHEFWAFYVNGEQAQVGAAEYVTKDTDEIIWKLEQYH